MPPSAFLSCPGCTYLAAREGRLCDEHAPKEGAPVVLTRRGRGWIVQRGGRVLGTLGRWLCLLVLGFLLGVVLGLVTVSKTTFHLGLAVGKAATTCYPYYPDGPQTIDVALRAPLTTSSAPASLSSDGSARPPMPQTTSQAPGRDAGSAGGRFLSRALGVLGVLVLVAASAVLAPLVLAGIARAFHRPSRSKR